MTQDDKKLERDAKQAENAYIEIMRPWLLKRHEEIGERIESLKGLLEKTRKEIEKLVFEDATIRGKLSYFDSIENDEEWHKYAFPTIKD